MPLPEFFMVDAAPTPVATFSHAAEVDGWVFLTGQMPTDPDDDSKPLPEGVEAQTRRVMDNLIIVLAGVGLKLENVVQARVYITEFERDYRCDEPDVQIVFCRRQTAGADVHWCHRTGGCALVEIDMVARRP